MARSASAVLAVLLLAALTGSASATRPAGSSAAVVCSESDVADLLARFVRSFNRGESDKLDAIWADGSAFRWYSATQSSPRKIHHVVDDRSELIRYFAARRDQRELLALKAFKQRRTEDGRVGVELLVVWRRALDLDRNRARRYHGKAAVVCRGDASFLATWSIGSEPRRESRRRSS